jgi:hypothetical protein
MATQTDATQSFMQIDRSDWSTVSNKRRRSADLTADSNAKQNNNGGELTLTNKFTPLNSIDAESTQKPPPIYVKDVALNKYKGLIGNLTEIAKNDFECQATQNNGVSIYPRTSEAYRKIVHYLKSINLNFHSFQLKEEKAYRVVIRHLHPATDPIEIKTALEELSFNVRSVVNVLQSGTRIPLPLFFVDLEPNLDNKKIFDIHSLLYTRIRVEEPKKKTDIVQCKRCMQFGHTRSYCNHAARCARCGNNHFTSDCKLESSDQRKCILCSGNHSATYRGCQTYKNLRNKRFNTNELSKANRRMVHNDSNLMLEQQASAVTAKPTRANVYFNASQKQPTTQLVNEKSDIQQPSAHISKRDPRLNTGTQSYSSVVSGRLNNSRRNWIEPSHQESISPDVRTHIHPNQINNNITTTLETFLTRFQDLITPLLSTLTLLVNKLLTTHG